MPGPWYTSAQLQVVLKNVLKIGPTGTLEDYWAPLCDEACATAYADFLEILLGKSFTIGQLDQWDNRVAYSRQQAMFWLYTESVLGLNTDDKEIAKLDRRKSLKESTTLMINNTPVAPGGPTDGGGTSGGRISEDGYRINSCTEF